MPLHHQGHKIIRKITGIKFNYNHRGSTTGSAKLRVYGDEVDEDDETIYVNVNVSGAGSENGTQTANISIVDDDTASYRFQHSYQ